MSARVPTNVSFSPGAQREAADHWTDHAACRPGTGVDAELFHPLSIRSAAARDRNVAEAKTICRRCPVVDDCLTWAIDSKEPNAIAGGMTPEERSEYMRGNRLVLAA